MSLMMSFRDRRRWRSARTFADLGELTAQWLEGSIASRPGYQPGYGPDGETTETPGLVEALALCNRSGYLTDASQPGLQDLGRDGKWWTQRAAVTGFVTDPAVLNVLRGVVEQYGLLIREHHHTYTGPVPEAIIVTERSGEPWTGFGGRLTGRDVRRIWRGAGRQAVAEVEQAWQVTIVAPYSGNFSPLWPALVAAFTEPDEVTCDGCGCTETNPCPGGCSWAPGTPDLCSACAYSDAEYDDTGDQDDFDFDDSPNECDLCGAPYYHGGRYCSFGCEEADAPDPDAPAELLPSAEQPDDSDPWSTNPWGQRVRLEHSDELPF